MSVYSGFATRNQQKHYDNVIYNLISTLMVRVVKFYKSQQVNQIGFKKIIKQQFKILTKLQKNKYLDPKYADLLAHFLKVLNQQNKNNQIIHQSNHIDFQQRRKSIQQYQIQPTFNRTLSVLGKQINQLKNYTDKIQTLQINEFNDHSQRKEKEKLYKIPQKSQKSKKKKHKNKSLSRQQNSIKSNIDLFQIRKSKLPEIPSLNQAIQQKIIDKTTNVRFRNLSQKNTQRSADQQSFVQINKKTLNKAPKFRSKMFFRQN